uniref:Uncharacterized protein n=1 Tax=Arundo donax TaxID=35708 RepID=A0A0A9F8W1_ARUDO
MRCSGWFFSRPLGNTDTPIWCCIRTGCRIRYRYAADTPRICIWEVSVKNKYALIGYVG